MGWISKIISCICKILDRKICEIEIFVDIDSYDAIYNFFFMQDESKDENEFPEKVDELLNYINNFYFDSKLDLNNKDMMKSFVMVSSCKPIAFRIWQSSFNLSYIDLMRQTWT